MGPVSKIITFISNTICKHFFPHWIPYYAISDVALYYSKENIGICGFVLIKKNDKKFGCM